MADEKSPPDFGLGMFNQERYDKITLNDRRGTLAGHLSPASTDGLANNAEAVISFYHLPSESDVFFKAFITSFAETYQSNWNEETVFGRTDPIYTFKNNNRRITLGWKIPADTTSEAYENLARLQRLAQFLYPTYANIAGTEVLSQSPLVRLKVMNLAQKSDDLSFVMEGVDAKTLFKSYTSTNNPSDGLLGAILSLNINHNLENPAAGVLQVKQNTVLPKLIEVSMDFAVIHESTLGWTSDKQSNFMDASFPYNAMMEKEDETVMKAESYDEKIEARKAAERDRVMAQQDLDNAKARNYDGFFGDKRRKRDVRRMSKLANKALQGKELSKRQMENFEYMASAQRGYIAQGGTQNEVERRQAEHNEGFAEFIE